MDGQTVDKVIMLFYPIGSSVMLSNVILKILKNTTYIYM